MVPRRLRKAATVVLLISFSLVGQGFSNAVVKDRVRKGELTISKECQINRKTSVRIEDVSLVCDSTGSYNDDDEDYDEDDDDANTNYGRYSSYTNEITCLPGDNAKLTIDCTYSQSIAGLDDAQISPAMHYDAIRYNTMQHNTSWKLMHFLIVFLSLSHLSLTVNILGKWNYTIGINITIEASFYGYTAVIRNRTDLCEFGNLAYMSNDDDDTNNNNNNYASSCPLRKGKYQLYTAFTVPRFISDKEVHFTPDMYLQFTDADDGHLLGCANTGAMATLDRGRRKSIRGARIFAASVVLFCTTFAVCLIGHRRKKRGGSHLLGSQKNASIIRRYHYRRTTRNGTVLVPNMSESDASSVAPAKVALREVT
jgi:hypothetical protein